MGAGYKFRLLGVLSGLLHRRPAGISGVPTHRDRSNGVAGLSSVAMPRLYFLTFIRMEIERKLWRWTYRSIVVLLYVLLSLAFRFCRGVVLAVLVLLCLVGWCVLWIMTNLWTIAGDVLTGYEPKPWFRHR